MTAETELVLAVAHKVVYGRQSRVELLLEKEDINWQRFKDMLIHHGLTAFAYHSLKEYHCLMPRSFYQVLESTYYQALLRICEFERKFLELHDMFKVRGISLIPIKGVALLEDLYSKCPIRQSVDVDILVRRKDIPAAVEILESSGYVKELCGFKESYWREKQYHFIFIKKNLAEPVFMLELHWDVDYPRNKRQLLPHLFDGIRRFSIQGKEVELLSPENTFFTLVLHQRRFGVALSLKDVCDIALLLNKYASGFDWEYVLADSRENGMRSAVFFALYQVGFFLGVDVPANVYSGLGIAWWKRKLICLLIKKDTFSTEQEFRNRTTYLKAHFLLYDSIWEPILYIINIPQEQFAKFYSLAPYDKKTYFFYKWRAVYILHREIILRMIDSAKRLF